jgi:predicted lipoprotein
VKVPRNASCPCGSGSKYKKCCGNAVATGQRSGEQSKDIFAVLLNDDGKNIAFKEGFVINQLRRDAPKIAQSFDRLCNNDLTVIDKYASRCFATTYVGIQKAAKESEEWRETCGRLLLNAQSTLLAATGLTRDGFILQPGVLIRNLIETLTAILCIMLDKEHW